MYLTIVLSAAAFRVGALDAFVVNEAGANGQYRLYFGDGHGRFSDSDQRWEFPRSALKPVAYDINGDGSKDVVIGRMVWLNDGQGRLTPERSLFLDSDETMFWQCRLADLNKDGLVDVVAIAMAEGETKARVYLNDNKGHFRLTGQPDRLNARCVIPTRRRRTSRFNRSMAWGEKRFFLSASGKAMKAGTMEI